MDEGHIFIVFVSLLLLERIVESLLILLNIKHAGISGSTLPEELAALYDEKTRQSAFLYTRYKGYFSIFCGIYSLIIFLILLFLDIFPRFDTWLARFSLSPNMHGLLYLLAIILFFSLVQLPISFYSSFVMEEKFGFNKTTKLLWVKDQILGLLLSLLMAGPVIYLLLFIMANLRGNWWIYAGFAIIAIQLFFAFIFPIWIAPIFNKFSDLKDLDLKEKIIKLVEKIGYRTTGVYSVDGSKRSKHANAYFAGLGKSKRIVLYDTLIELLGAEEILAVLAHEIGHEKLGHIKKSILFSSIITFAGFFLLFYFYNSPEMYKTFGFQSQSNHAALLIFVLVAGPVSYFFNPFFNMLSRRYEYQADNFAISAAGHYEPLATALAALSKNSLSNLNPHPLYSFMHYSHPATAERIRAMKDEVKKSF
jgi:STE24 endopeptidase